MLTSIDMHKLNVWVVLTRFFGLKKKEEESTEVLIQTLFVQVKIGLPAQLFDAEYAVLNKMPKCN